MCRSYTVKFNATHLQPVSLQLISRILLTPGRCACNLRLEIFKLILSIATLNISCEIALRWMRQNLIDQKSILCQVMAWCHYMNPCWTISKTPYGCTKPPLGNKMIADQDNNPCNFCWTKYNPQSFWHTVVIFDVLICHWYSLTFYLAFCIDHFVMRFVTMCHFWFIPTISWNKSDVQSFDSFIHLITHNQQCMALPCTLLLWIQCILTSSQ